MADTPLNKLVRIELTYADGTVERAEGDRAHEIWAAIFNCMSIAQLHGLPYRGPKLTRVEPPAPGQDAADGSAGSEG